MIVDFSFPRVALGAGSFSITIALHLGDEHTHANFDWWDRALVFEVLPGSGPVTIGVCSLAVEASWQTQASVTRSALLRSPQ
jgi:lipopolysaccharide transport system ATP-binding protein